jgi:hypothetical protein
MQHSSKVLKLIIEIVSYVGKWAAEPLFQEPDALVTLARDCGRCHLVNTGSTMKRVGVVQRSLSAIDAEGNRCLNK